MTIKTLLKYLCGNRQAIFEVAGQPKLLWVGLLFVLSAGFAREYDQEDLWYEPWYLLIPLGASLVSSFVLYLFILPFWKPALPNVDYSLTYRSFLKLYWMTAPLAWLYAIPVERFLSSYDAVATNLWLLAIVAIWRVLLITRAIAVLRECPFYVVLAVVMLFSELLTLSALFFSPLNPLLIMGGIAVPAEDRLVRRTAELIYGIGFFTFPLCLILTPLAWKAVREHRLLTYEKATPLELPPTHPIARNLWVLAIFSLAIWIPVLPYSQPEQRNRRLAEELYDPEHPEKLVRFLSAHKRTDFPPHWEPPPEYSYRGTPETGELLKVILTTESAPWVLDLQLEKLCRHSNQYQNRNLGLSTFDLELLEELVVELESRPELGPKLSARLYSEIDDTLRSFVSDQRLDLMDRLLKLAQSYDDKLPASRHEKMNYSKGRGAPY